MFGGVGSPAAVPFPKPPSVAEQLASLFKGKEETVRAFLVSRGQLKAEGSWGDIAQDYAERILGQPERFLGSVEQFAAAFSSEGGVK